MKTTIESKALVIPYGVGLKTPQAILQTSTSVKEHLEYCINYHLNNGGSILEFEPFEYIDKQINAFDKSILIQIPKEEGDYPIYRINPLWWYGRLLFNTYLNGQPIYSLEEYVKKSNSFDYNYFSKFLYLESLDKAKKHLRKITLDTYEFKQICYKPIVIKMSLEEYQQYLAIECQVIQHRLFIKFMNVYNLLRNDNDSSIRELKRIISEIPKTLHTLLFDKVEQV